MKTKNKTSTAKLLFWLVFMPLVLIVLFVLFVLGGYTDIKRSIYCGPSESITKPMAEAIVREINKRGTPNKIVKLDSLGSLPYGLVECEKDIFFKKDRTFNGLLTSYQTCSFYDDKKEYKVRVEYTELESDGDEIYRNGRGRLHIYISKIGILKPDFTEKMHRVAKIIIIDGEWISTTEWNIIGDSQTNYSKKTKGLCRYKSPIHL